MSEYNQNVRGYMQDGLGEKEAKSKATKTDIIVADDIDDNINSMYDIAMQRIVLNANNESALYYTVFHEGVGKCCRRTTRRKMLRRWRRSVRRRSGR